MDKNKLLSNFQADLKAADQFRRVNDIRIKNWKSQENGELYGNEQDGKSKIVSRDVKKQKEWEHANIIDPFVSSSDIVKCSPITFEDRLAARQSEILLNTQFCRQFPRFNFMSKVVKVLSSEGTVIIQTGWDYEEDKVKVKSERLAVDINGNEFIAGYEEVLNTVVKRNNPTAKVCRNEDIYLDPTCQDNIEDAQFIIYRYESDLSTLKNDGRYKNLDKIPVANLNIYDDNSYISPDKTYFRFEDDPRRKLLVYEYWGNYDVNEDGIAEAIVCTWVNNTIIRLQSNPYPDKKPPFIIASINSIPFQMYGEANAEMIGDNQKIKTAIIRGVIDNMALSNNGQKGVKKGALDVANRKKFLANQNFEFNTTPNDFWDGSYNQIPASVFDMLAMMNNEIESMTGTKSFSGGINASSLGATATGVRGALDATATRRLNTVRNIAENVVKPLMRKWMSYNLEFMSEQEIVRFTNEEFVQINKDDLEGNIDIDIEVSTAEDNAAKAQELAFLIQTMGPNEDPEIKKLLRIAHLELLKLPAEAKMVKEYKPQANPAQQQMEQLQLQLLQAQVYNEQMKGQENKIDGELKMARARLDMSKAALIGSQKDLHDLEFLKKESGKDVTDKLKELEFQYRSQKDLNHDITEREVIKLKHKLEAELDKQDNATINKLKAQLGVIE